ncbi:hypothetical protein [Streptomyces sp. NBC_00887]|uniref:hypothetical protein n=1 Tax=Streptomyces sp. NBC_00887 TaxID=2975859 RepID=UPI00386622FB|nr:hypothetical protein OG844_29735 [Streptomyces sp. NBC_00887]
MELHRGEAPEADPAGHPRRRRLRGFRRGRESQHSSFDQSNRPARVPAYGANAAPLIYIGYASLSNSVARAKIAHSLAA